MEFASFGLIIKEFVYPNHSKSDGIQQLFLDISDFDDDEENPLLDIQGPTWRGYLLKNRGISRVARLVVDHLDPRAFIRKIDNLPPDTLNLLVDAFLEECPDIKIDNAGTVLARLFTSIIVESLDKGRNGDTSQGLCLPFSMKSKDILLTALLSECHSRCPSCGCALSRNGGRGKRTPEIVSIVPPDVRKDYRVEREYKRVAQKMPDLNSDDNLIVLCSGCALEYIRNPTPESFARLVNQKERIKKQQELWEAIIDSPLESEIELVLSSLASQQLSEIKSELAMTAVRIDNKVARQEYMVAEKIRMYVVQYYNFIEEQMRSLEASDKLDFVRLATQVKLCYQNMRKEISSQEACFNWLVKWVQEKTGSNAFSACEAVVSFFVQNCEVFNEIAQ